LNLYNYINTTQLYTTVYNTTVLYIAEFIQLYYATVLPTTKDLVYHQGSNVTASTSIDKDWIFIKEVLWLNHISPLIIMGVGETQTAKWLSIASKQIGQV
jgi:hypothetical protein